MKPIVHAIAPMIISAALVGSSVSGTKSGKHSEVPTNHQNEPSVYDSLLARKLGADEYGMKTYVMALLKAGPKRDHDSATVAAIQEAHLKNILRLAVEGKLILAGPFLDGVDLRGIFVFNVETLKEARILTESDPAVQSGRLVMELHPWYGPASLVQVEAMNERIAKRKMVE